MYIKRLTIHGFKSYRDQTIIEPFSAGHNVVVGRNGSGKSNFFAAIRFVLHDAYTKLGQEERQALLHEGGASNNISAYVEIVFDNGDNRFPTGRDEVILRRSIGLKKDEYSLDRKPVTKTDVANLLQSAGFSKSNPYYIVPQGRITALTNAKDGERLVLLKEVAGTRVYEEHRAESIKIMEETELKRSKIDELLVFIKERLEELEEEKEELGAYLRLERQRRLLEHVIYDREQREASEQLQALEVEYRDLLVGSAEQQELLEEQRSTIQRMEEQLVAMQRALHQLATEHEGLAEDKAEQMRTRTQLQLALDELGEQEARCMADAKGAQGTLIAVEREISEAEGRLETLRPEILKLSEQESQLSLEQATMEAQREALMARRGRAGQFRTKADRDRWIRKEIEALEGTATLQAQQLQELREEEDSLHIRVGDVEGLLRGMEEGQEARGRAAEEAQNAHHQARQRRDAGMEGRKELWRIQAKLEQSIGEIREEVSRCERDLASLLDRATLQGLGAVERIAHRLGLQARCHGPLWSLFRVDPVFRVAVETVGGASLFHWVVDDDETASRILEEMQRERAGRVTFIPLNRLASIHNNNTISTDNLLPASSVRLLEQLEFSDRFAPAMAHVFGKAVVVEALAEGAMLARQHRITALTLAGDRVDRKGALTGGYCDQKRSRMEAVARLQGWREKQREHQDLLEDIQAKLAKADQQVTLALAEMSRLEGQRQAGGLMAVGVAEIQARRRELAALRSILESKQLGIRRLETDLQKTRQSIGSLQEELALRLTDQDFAQVAAELEAINQRILASPLPQVTEQLGQLRTLANQLETRLSEQLYRRRTELQERQARHSGEALSRQRVLLEGDMAHLNLVLERIQAAMDEAARGREEMEREHGSMRVALEKARGHLEAEAGKGDANAGRLTRYLGRRTALLERREEAMARLKSGVVFTTEDYEQIESINATTTATSTQQILHQLHQCQESLKAYAHVNKKAADQHASFTRQGQQLIERQVELEQSARAIEEFVRVLDQRKDEAIERTFQQVAQSFGQVFQKLVPQGRGELVMLRGPKNVVEYTGIAIRVSFNSHQDEGLLMSQLSGGQKSLVALALIFAIQQCDPAPFYLFDEIDANLDAAHRTAVASLIHEMAHPTTSSSIGGDDDDDAMMTDDANVTVASTSSSASVQFITTTFRPELLQHADKFYGVSFGARVSRVETISRDQAMQFVEGNNAIVSG